MDHTEIGLDSDSETSEVNGRFGQSSWVPADPTHRSIRGRLTPGTLAKLLRFIVIRLRFRNLRSGIFSVDRGCTFDIGRKAVVQFGTPLIFSRDFTGCFYGEVTVGDNVFFNRGCYLSAYTKVTIGSNCLFGEYVSIHDENHVIRDDDLPIAERGFFAQPIHIGNNVWVGSKVTILSGVTIGDNAVIGANAVVTKSVSPNSIVGGVPARKLHER